jgi:thiamine biosynthesis lipoprotein
MRAAAVVDLELAAVDGRALGCATRVVVTRPAELSAAAAAVSGVLDAVDLACSRFRDDSELAAVNATPERDVPISPLLAEAIRVSLRAARLTDGAVDPTLGTAVKAAGYDVDFDSVPEDGKAISPEPAPAPAAGWRRLRFDAERRTLRVPADLQIDLGATAKALAADLAAQAAATASGGGVLVIVGGDIAVCGRAPLGGWPVQIGEDSGEPMSPEAEAIRIWDGGVATSSTTVRRWRRGGVELHHIIDPRTGLPAQGPWRTATVVAASCVDANTASTAAIVMGGRALAWLHAQGLPARLVSRRGAVRCLVGWPEPGRIPA